MLWLVHHSARPTLPCTNFLDVLTRPAGMTEA
jgi:hypothetical protein